MYRKGHIIKKIRRGPIQVLLTAVARGKHFIKQRTEPITKDKIVTLANETEKF